MGDVIDQAEELIELAADIGIKHSRDAINKAPSPVTHCVECDEEIHPRRKAAIPSTDLCGGCATLEELRNKRSSGR